LLQLYPLSVNFPYNHWYRISPGWRLDSEIFPNRHGGGEFILVRTDIPSSLLHQDVELELLWVHLHATINQDIILGSFYCPPNPSASVFEELPQTSLVNIKHQFPNAFILLGGDFNCPLPAGINWSNGTLLESYLSVTSREALLRFSNDFYLDQIVLQPTRANNILDLCFTSHPDKIEWCNTLPGLSDHEAVHVKFAANLHKGKYLPKKVYM